MRASGLALGRLRSILAAPLPRSTARPAMKLSRALLPSLAALSLAACVDNDGGSRASGGPGAGLGPRAGCAALNTVDIGAHGERIVDLDAANLSPIVTDVFSRYTAVLSPNGDRIHILAQAGVSDARIRRSRRVLEMHLEDVPGTSAGATKFDIADAVAGFCGTLAIFTDPSRLDLADPAVARFDEDFGGSYVPLFGDRVIVEGSNGYTAASPAVDQTFGATAALVYRLGIVPRRPDWTNQLRLAEAAATLDGTFTAPDPGIYRTRDERFLTVALEAHSGVWGHDPSGDGSADFGTYAFGSRPDMEAGDASTVQLLEDFFTPEHTFLAELDPAFGGNFDLLFRESIGYTNRSQYLRRVTLTGDNTAEIFGAEGNNVLTGNAGNNNLNGRAGDDLLDGGPGLDSAIYFAPRAEFTITANGDGSTTVRHDVTPGLGTDTLRNIEILVFSDQNVNL